MASKNQDVMDQVREHVYDGIQEYDNPLPSWWVWLFLLSIAFGVAYLGWYHAMGGKSLLQAFKEDALAQQALLQGSGQSGGGGEAASEPVDYAVKYADQALVEAGREAYQTNCAPCHGDKGQGGIGPNLTDAFWLHGGDAASITNSIADGIPDKGMPGWKAVLGPSKAEAAAAFVFTSLRNTNVDGGKAPQGDEVK
jgi:cytochrome c oxidase cbb3-type subunit 3